MFEGIVGNEKVKSYLLKALERDALGSSLLFAGPDGIGKALFAKALAIAYVCGDDSRQRQKAVRGNHPDIQLLKPEGKLALHSVSSLRRMIDDVNLKPYESKRKTFLIFDAERMLPTSSNALLKTFEEPPLDTLIILISGLPEKLLPTIRSRCRLIPFKALSGEEIASYLQKQYNIENDIAYDYALQAQGSLRRAIDLVEKRGNPLHSQMLQLLSHGPYNYPTELIQAVQAIAENVDKGVKDVELSIKRETLASTTLSDLPAVMQHQVMKEVEGAAAGFAAQQAQGLFEVIQRWFRDMTLLSHGGKKKLLCHPDSYQKTMSAMKRGFSRPLDDVEKVIADAKLAMERSDTLEHAMQNALIKLGYLR